MTHNPERISVVVPAYNEATLIRGTLDSLTHQRTDVECHVIVVDNNSTDDTPGIVDDYPGVTLLHEPAQGTGYAANTGFQYAIEEDHPAVIMRTDADTVPIQDWVEAARYYLAEHSSKQLISGLVRPLKDEYYRWSDEILLPASYVAYRIGVSAIKATLWPLRVARGGNVAIRPDAFKNVDGFPDCSIEDEDDDLELTRRIYAEYGLQGLGNVRAMEVRTSMRRIRKVGWLGLGNYYFKLYIKVTCGCAQANDRW